jgi:broad specificity phosphatase PhoE
MRIILVRHGQPDWSPGGLVSNDPVLTELGQAQAERLADRRWGHVDHLWVSTFTRARQTAIPIEHHLGIEAEVHPWMAEIGPADAWDGLRALVLMLLQPLMRSAPASAPLRLALRA